MEDHGPSGSSRHPHPHPHCSFVLLAEFDIDRGSTLAHVYPNKDLVKEHDDHTLAELMLPDGAHARSEDWTVFLIKNPSQDTEHPHVTYVLNLVRTKHDDSVRRGALVKAIAIGTHHPCIHVFKPILLLALDDYFDDPGPSSLARLYDAINSLDLTPAPSLTRSEKLILRANDRNDFFLDRFHNSSRPGSSASHHLQPPAPTPAPPHLPRDTHFWDTSIQYAKMDIPIKWPMDAFEDEVGEYSISTLFATFSNQPVAGPLHAHLHSNGSQTPPMAILFNAIITYKRVIFLGHNLPAATVAGHVLAAAALASGCGAVLPGLIQERCSPYANLISLDTLEQTPGYIAGVTNPRFEELKCWDVLCNIETGKITIAKDIEPATKLSLVPFGSGGPATGASASSAASMNMSYTSGMGSLNGSMGISNDVDYNMNRRPSGSSASHHLSLAPTSSGSGSGTNEFGALSPSQSLPTIVPPSGIPEARSDSFDVLFIDELLVAISSRFGEAYVRSRVIDYVTAFTRHVTRHEDYFYGPSPPALHRFLHQPYLNGQLGSGNAFGDREGEMKEIISNAGRVEGFRSTRGYREWVIADADRRITQRATFSGGRSDVDASPDIWHQISRLRGRGKPMSGQEVDLIFATLDRCVRNPGQIIELLTLLPNYAGGLSPLAHGLYHPSPTVRLSACELLTRIGTHTSAGLKMLQSMPLFHRLALARIQHQVVEDTQRWQGVTTSMQSPNATTVGTPQTATSMTMTTSMTPTRSKSPGGVGSPLNIATLKQRQALHHQLDIEQQQQQQGLPQAGSTFLAAPGKMTRQASNTSVVTVTSSGDAQQVQAPVGVVDGLPQSSATTQQPHTPSTNSTFRELRGGGGD